MRLTGKKYILQAAFDKAFSLVKRNTSPALAQGYIGEIDGTVRLVGSDGEKALVVPLDQIEIENFKSCLIPSVVHDAIGRCPEADITIDVTDVEVLISSGNYNASFRQEMAEYPVPSLVFEQPTYIQKEDFQQALVRCLPAIQSPGVRPNFAFAQLTGSRVRATDGFKLHSAPLESSFSMLIPFGAINEIRKQMASMVKDVVAVVEQDNAYLFKFDETILRVTKHEVAYPDLDTHILAVSAPYDQHLAFNKKELMDVVKRSALASDEDTKYITLGLSADSLTVSSYDKYGNQSGESMAVQWKGYNRDLGVNYQHLVDLLTSYPDGEVNVFLGDDGDQRLSFLRFGPTDDGFLGVLTRLRSDLGGVVQTPTARVSNQPEQRGWSQPESVAVVESADVNPELQSDVLDGDITADLDADTELESNFSDILDVYPVAS